MDEGHGADRQEENKTITAKIHRCCGGHTVLLYQRF